MKAGLAMAASVLAALLALPAQLNATTSISNPGEKIYRDGILPSGAPLTAQRGAGLRLQGGPAA